MRDSREHDRQQADHRRRIRRTVVMLAAVAALIYIGFIARGVIG